MVNTLPRMIGEDAPPQRAAQTSRGISSLLESSRSSGQFAQKKADNECTKRNAGH
jgi:hypothetical protein